MNLLLFPLFEEPLAAGIGHESAQVALDTLFAEAIGFVPVACGIAITRHGLYEIDRILCRTVSYAVREVDDFAAGLRGAMNAQQTASELQAAVRRTLAPN